MQKTTSFRKTIQKGFPMTFGSLLYALNLVLFLTPARIAPGGVSGTTVILHELFGLPSGIMVFVLNIPLLILGFLYLGGANFLRRTLYSLLVYSISAELLSRLLPPLSITDDVLLSAIYAGVLGGLGAGLVYRSGATVGGTEIISRILQRRSGLPVSQLYLLTDGSVVILAAFVLGWESALYAFITIFIWGLASDFVLEGPSVIRTAFIVTDHPQDVAEAVLEKLHLGLTAWTGTGMYTGQERSVLFCTVSRPDVNSLRSIVASVDQEAFLVIGQGHQASGGVIRRQLKADPVQEKDEAEEAETDSGEE